MIPRLIAIAVLFGLSIFSDRLLANVDILVIGSTRSFSEGNESGVVQEKAFNPVAITAHLQGILSQDPAFTGSVNVEFEDIYKTKAQTVNTSGASTDNLSSHCYSLAQHYLWPDGKAARLANLRGEGARVWDYIVLCNDPYITANFPGMVAEGVKLIQTEVAKSANPAQVVLLGQWPEDSSTFTANHFNEIAYRVGNSAGITVVPAGKAWSSYGSKDTSSNHPTPRGEYLAAASIYSKLFNRNANTSAYTYPTVGSAIASHALSVVQANNGVSQYSGSYTSFNPFQMKYLTKRVVSYRETGTSTEDRLAQALDRLDDVQRITLNTTGYAGVPGTRWDFNYGRGGDVWEDDKDYEVNPAIYDWVYGFPMHHYTIATAPITMPYGIDKHYINGTTYEDGTDLGIPYNMIRPGTREPDWPEAVRAIPIRLMWQKMAEISPGFHPLGDSTHMHPNLNDASAAFMYTLISGRCPIVDEPTPKVATNPAWMQWLGHKTGYETAWQISHLTTRSPGFKVLPASVSSTSVTPTTNTTMTVQFMNPPQSDVTVNVSISNANAAIVGSKQLVFTPQNHRVPQSVVVSGLHGSAAGEAFNVVFTTVSADEIFNELSDSWAYQTTRSAPVTLTRVEKGTTQFTANQNLPVTINLNTAGASSANTILSGPSRGNIAWSGSNVIYTPSTDFLGKDGFSFAVNNAGTLSVGYIEITVTGTVPNGMVSYRGNGSNGGAVPIDSNTYAQNATVTVLGNTGNLTRVGHNFTGWNTAANGSGTTYNAGSTFNMGASGMILHAQWTSVPNYTITYNGNTNNGGFIPSNQIKTDGVNLTLATNSGALIKTGYTFAGWNTVTNGTGVDYAAGGIYSGNANLTLHAKWTPNIYTVTFSANGGDAPSPTSKSVTYNTPYGALATISRSGHTFNGWFTATTGGTQILSTTNVTITGNQTLHARWTASTSYTVSYDANGATSGTVPANQIQFQDVSLTLATNSGGLTRTGFTFTGWNTAANGSGTAYPAGASYIGNAAVTLFAQWSGITTYTVSYNGNGNSAGTAPSNQTKTQGVSLTLASNSGNLTRTGFGFAGWNTAANGSGIAYPAGAIYTNDSSTTLHAQWNALPVVNAGVAQTVTLSGTSWSPAQLTPQLWLDADDASTITLNGATVSEWRDKSGNARHAAQFTAASQPARSAAALNGKSVLTFDGTADFLNLGTGLDFLAGASHSAFIVTKPTTFNNIYGAANGSAGANSLHVGFSGTDYRMNFWANDYLTNLTTNFVSGSANIVNYVWITGASKQILANGKSEGLITDPIAGTIGTMSGGGRIGNVVGQGFMGGDIAEMVFFTGAVSAADRESMEGYLAHKWGMTANLAAAHPYKNTSPGGSGIVASLDGTATDADPLTHSWSVVSGPSTVSFANVAAIDTGVTFTVAGVYTLRLTVNDGISSVSSDIVVTVNSANLGNSLTYSGNGSTGGTTPVDANSPYTNGATVTVLGNTGSLIRNGYTFNSWNTAADGSGITYAPGNTFTIGAATTLFARWTPNTYAVTYNANSATSGTIPAAQSKIHDVSLTLQNNTGTLARTGYTFVGWNTQADGLGTTFAVASAYANNAALTLFAQWSTNSYTITFNSAGGSPVSAITQNFGTTVTAPANPTRSGYTFAGWNPALPSTMPANNQAVTAQWTLGNFLTWDANGTAANQTNGGGAWEGTNLWWDGAANQTWASGVTAIFGGASTAGGPVALAGPTLVESFTFNTFTGTYTLGSTGQAITINSGINKTSTSGIVSIISPVVIGGSQTWTNQSSSALTASSTLNNGGNTLTAGGTGTITMSGVISGAGGFVKNGTGRLSFGASGNANSYTGSTIINGGILSIANNSASLGSGNLTINGGVLGFYWSSGLSRTLGTGSNQVTIPGGESGFGGDGGSGPIINLGTTMVWGASGQGAATGHFNPSKLVLGSPDTPNAGVTIFSSAIDLNGSTRTIVAPKGLSVGGNVSTISAAISSSSGTAGLIKEGDGILILSAANTYTGNTTISGGILRIGNNSAGTLNSGNYSASISIATGATLQIWSSAAQTLSGTISGGGGLHKAFGGALTLSGSNTYSGRTSFLPQTVAGCTVNITSYNSVNGGAPLFASSSLGAPTTIANGTIDVGSGLAQAGVNLTYTGSGETTDRVINFGFNGGSSQTLTASGSGLLKFTSAMVGNSITTQSGALVLSGTGSGEITQALPALPAGGLTKNGTGTWSLRGANAYTVPTSITAGKLFIHGNQSSATGNVTVSANATLGGSGTIGGNTTIATGGRLEFDISTTAGGHNPLDLAAGRALTFSGTSTLTITSSSGSSPGVYTLITGGNNIIGSAPSTLNLPLGWAATVSISGNSLLLNVTSIGGSDTTAPTVVSINDNLGGSSVVANSTVNYTVTFSEDMDASSVQIADFGNAGSAAGVINSVTEPSPGVFLVSVTPSSAGSLQLRINAGAVLSDLVGNSLNTTSAIPDDTTITVTPLNVAPVAVSQNVTTNEDTALPVTLTATDANNDPLAYTVLSAPANGTLSGVAPNLTFTPALNFNGAASFTFRVNDGALNSNIATIVITVTAVNDAPVAAAQSVTTAEDTAVPITLIGTDEENSPLTYTVVSAPANGTLSGVAPNLTFTPASNFNGAASFTFRVNDGALNSNTATIVITVTAVNDAPVFTENPIILAGVSENVAYSGQTLSGRATDVDSGDSLSYSKISGPAWLVVAVNGDLSGTPPIGSGGVNSFVVRVTDIASATSDATMQITIALSNSTLADAYLTSLAVSSPTTITAALNFPSFLDGPLTGSSTLTHTGFVGGQLSLVGNSGNTFDGNIHVNGGILRLAGSPFATTAGGFIAPSMTSADTITINRAGTLTIDDNVASGYTANRFGTGASSARPVVDLTGGRLNLNGLNAASSSVQTFGDLTASSGYSIITNTRNSNGNPTLTYDSLAINKGAVLSFFSATLGTGAADARITFTSAPILTNGIIRGAKVWNPGAAGQGEFATYGANGVTPFTAYDLFAANDINAATSTQNARMTGAFTPVALTADRTVNSMNFNGNGGTWSLGGNKLTIGSGMFLRNGTNAAVTINNGTLTAGNGIDDVDLHIFTAQQNVAIDAVIADNSASAVTLVKSHGNALTVSGAANNIYTGGTYVVDGVLSTSNVANRTYLGTGKVTVDGTSELNLGAIGATSNSTGDDFTVINGGRINLSNGNHGTVDTFHIGAGSVIAGGSGNNSGLASLSRGTNVTLAEDAIIGHQTPLAAALNLTTHTIRDLGTDADLYFGISSFNQVSTSAAITIGNGTAFKGLAAYVSSTFDGGTINVASGTSDVYIKTNISPTAAPNTLTLGDSFFAGAPVIVLSDVGTVNVNVLGNLRFNDTTGTYGNTGAGRNVRFVSTAGSTITVTQAAGMGSTSIASALVQNGGSLAIGNAAALNGAVTVEAGGRLLASQAAGLTGIGALAFNAGSILEITNATGFSGVQATAASIAAGTIVRINNGAQPGTATVTLDSILGSKSPIYQLSGDVDVPEPSSLTTTMTLNKNGSGVGGIVTNGLASAFFRNNVFGQVTIGANGGVMAATTGTELQINENIEGTNVILTFGTTAIIDGLPKLGSVALGSAAGSNNYTGENIISAGTVRQGYANVLGALTNQLTVNDGRLNMNAQALTVGNLTGTGGIINGGGTLTIGQGDNGGGNYQGSIQANNAIIKTGTGTITLSGTNSYNGNTAINAGKLIINGNQSTASGNVTVAANATLGGTGTLGGSTTIAAGGKLEFDFSTPAGSHNPLDLVSGKTLTFSGASTLTITSSSGAESGTYTLITGGNNITGTAPATLNLPVGWAATVSISGNSLLLNVTSTGSAPMRMALNAPSSSGTETTSSDTTKSSLSSGATTSGTNTATDPTTQITESVLPLPWTSTDIGTGMRQGSATHSAGSFTQAGSGLIGSTADKLSFTYQTLTGDGEIIAKISNLQNTGNAGRVGVMIRDSLAANSMENFVGMTGSNAYRWDRRNTTGGATTSANSSTGTVPNTWVRLVRSGSTITTYKSSDGSSWIKVGSATNTNFASTCYIGLAVGSGSDTTLNTSQFSNVSVTP